MHQILVTIYQHRIDVQRLLNRDLLPVGRMLPHNIQSMRCNHSQVEPLRLTHPNPCKIDEVTEQARQPVGFLQDKLSEELVVFIRIFSELQLLD